MSGILRLGRTVVSTPDGVEWAVGRRWLPRPPRWVGLAFRNLRRDDDWAPRIEGEQRSGDWWEGLQGVGELGDAAAAADDVPGVGAVFAVVGVVVAVVLVAVLLFAVVLPALILVLDLALVLTLAAIAVTGRVLFRRPWEIVATGGGDSAEWAVVGWAASRRAIRYVTARLARGDPIGDIHPRLR